MKTLSGAVLVLVACVLPLAACGGSPSGGREQELEDYARAHGVNADVELDENGEVRSLTMDQGGAQVGNDLALPPDFPSDVPRYPGLSIYGLSPMPGGGVSVSARTGDAAAEVADFYRREMTANGWTESSPEQVVGTQRMLRFTKGSRNAMVNLISADPGTTVGLTLMDLG